MYTIFIGELLLYFVCFIHGYMKPLPHESTKTTSETPWGELLNLFGLNLTADVTLLFVSAVDNGIFVYFLCHKYGLWRRQHPRWSYLQISCIKKSPRRALKFRDIAPTTDLIAIFCDSLEYPFHHFLLLHGNFLKGTCYSLP